MNITTADRNVAYLETQFDNEMAELARLYRLHKKGKPRMPVIRERLERALVLAKQL